MKNIAINKIPVALSILALFFVSFANPLLAAPRTKLNFNNVEVLSTIKLMSKVTGRSFIFNERDLKGKKITLLSDQRFTSNEAYRIFEEVLKINGLATIEEGRVTRIVQDKQAKIITTPLYSSKTGFHAGAYVTRIFPIKNLSARALRSTLSPLISKSAIFVANEHANILILRDTKENTNRLAEMVSILDKVKNGAQVKLYTLKHAEANKLVGVLSKVVAGASGPSKGVKRTAFSADIRTNTLIAVHTNENAIPMIEQLIKDIDQPASAVALEVMKLKHATSNDLASIMSRVFPRKKGADVSIQAIADKRTNSLILIGHPESILKSKELITQLDQEVDEADDGNRGNIRVFPLRNANAKKVAEVLQKVARTLKTSTPKPVRGRAATQSPTTIIPDIPTNALVVYAEPEIFPALESVIKKLDVVRPQVFIQALIMETQLSKSLDLGVQWQGGKLVNQGTESEGFATMGGVGATGGPKTVESTLQDGAGAVAGIIGTPIRFGGKDYASFNAFIKATQRDTEIDILSSPQILTLNNEEAEIKVGEIIPTVGSSKVDANGNTTTSIDYKEVGLSLKITPQINSDNSIALKIAQTTSNVVEGKIGAFDQGAITTLNRELKTTVTVANGQTVVLGGLISDDITQVENKTPCLGDIPILGWMFKFHTTSARKTNLIVFLSPKVVKNQEDLNQLTETRINKIKSSRKGRFRIDVSKEYEMPSLIKGKSKEIHDEEEEAEAEAESETASTEEQPQEEENQ